MSESRLNQDDIMDAIVDKLAESKAKFNFKNDFKVFTALAELDMLKKPAFDKFITNFDTSNIEQDISRADLSDKILFLRAVVARDAVNDEKIKPFVSPFKCSPFISSFILV